MDEIYKYFKKCDMHLLTNIEKGHFPLSRTTIEFVNEDRGVSDGMLKVVETMTDDGPNNRWRKKVGRKKHRDCHMSSHLLLSGLQKSPFHALSSLMPTATI